MFSFDFLSTIKLLLKIENSRVKVWFREDSVFEIKKKHEFLLQGADAPIDMGLRKNLRPELWKSLRPM